MVNGLDKIVGAFMIPLVWIGSIEWRLRNKVSRDTFDVQQAQTNRIESHLWDLMKAQHITPSIEPPDEIKNNHK